MKTWVRKHRWTALCITGYLSWATIGLLIDMGVIPDKKVEIELFTLFNSFIMGLGIGIIITSLYFKPKFDSLTRQFDELTEKLSKERSFTEFTEFVHELPINRSQPIKH